GRSTADVGAGTRLAAGRRRRSDRRARPGARRSPPRSPPDEVVTRVKCMARRPGCQAWPRAWKRIARRYTQPVAKREPHVVLGIEPTASPNQIKEAGGKLRREA